MSPPAGTNVPEIGEFLALWAIAYIVLAIVYFAVGLFIIAMNRRFPDRRIPAMSERDNRIKMPARDEIRSSLLALIATAFCISGGLYMQHLGWTQAPLELTPISAAWTFVAGVVLMDAWFYFQHRLMHSKVLFRRFHARHHRSSAPTVWSNNAFGVFDAFLVQAFFLALPFIVPISPFVLIFSRLFDEVRGLIGHSGYDFFAGRLARKPWPFLCPLHHDLHHQHFNVNFGNQFTLWDRWLGTLDPSYDRLVRQIEEGRPPVELRSERPSRTVKAQKEA
jgi:lathosterol oxidase